jgi:hypothetical protein
MCARVNSPQVCEKRDIFTVKHESPINEGDVSREEKQDFDRCPRSRPDEGDFAWESQ